MSDHAEAAVRVLHEPPVDVRRGIGSEMNGRTGELGADGYATSSRARLPLAFVAGGSRLAPRLCRVTADAVLTPMRGGTPLTARRLRR
ncbi:MAG TPA: hypothetical protein VNO31_23110, partial [Umezawaea sp.]|nr:hypothetical protein [Umezawaea sp.]